MASLVIPAQYLREALFLLRQRPGVPVWSPLGRCDTAADSGWLAGPVAVSQGSTPPSGNGNPTPYWLRIRTMTEPPASTNAHSSPALDLRLGSGELRGRLWLHSHQAVPSVEAVLLVGPGMYRIPVAGTESLAPNLAEPAETQTRSPASSPGDGQRFARFRTSEDSDDRQSIFPPTVPDTFAGRLGFGVLKRLASLALTHSPYVRWSRTIGGLGGEGVWERLTRLRVAVVGCGRSGSVLAEMLGGLGINSLVLIDPDLLEQHNLGEMAGVHPEQVGLPKVQVLVELLRRHGSPHMDLEDLAEPLWSSTALQAAKQCDLLFVAADHDAARLTAAIFSTLYHKVLIDCATGIQFPTPSSATSSPFTQPSARVMGADVRLIVPGDGCLLCQGNLTNYMDAVETLCHQPMLTPALVDWRRQRVGSLRSLNTTAAALAVRLLEDLVAERLTGSVWAHLEFDAAGRLTVTYPTHSPSAPCVLCTKAGLGDAGLNWG